MFTVKNAVRVALMQVGVIVFGILGVGVSAKAWKSMLGSPPLPPGMEWLGLYGPLMIFIPPAWIVFAVLIHRRPGIPDGAKALAFVSGILIVLALIGLFGFTLVPPWLRVRPTLSDGE